MPLGPPEVAETFDVHDYAPLDEVVVSMPLGPPEVAETVRDPGETPVRPWVRLNALRATRGR